jgi:hypothetical protein
MRSTSDSAFSTRFCLGVAKRRALIAHPEYAAEVRFSRAPVVRHRLFVAAGERQILGRRIFAHRVDRPAVNVSFAASLALSGVVSRARADLRGQRADGRALRSWWRHRRPPFEAFSRRRIDGVGLSRNFPPRRTEPGRI